MCCGATLPVQTMTGAGSMRRAQQLLIAAITTVEELQRDAHTTLQRLEISSTPAQVSGTPTGAFWRSALDAAGPPGASAVNMDCGASSEASKASAPREVPESTAEHSSVRTTSPLSFAHSLSLPRTCVRSLALCSRTSFAGMLFWSIFGAAKVRASKRVRA